MEIMKITKIRGKKIEKTNSKTTNKLWEMDTDLTFRSLLKDYGNKTQNQNPTALEANPRSPENLRHRRQTL